MARKVILLILSLFFIMLAIILYVAFAASPVAAFIYGMTGSYLGLVLHYSYIIFLILALVFFLSAFVSRKKQ